MPDGSGKMHPFRFPSRNPLTIRLLSSVPSFLSSLQNPSMPSTFKLISSHPTTSHPSLVRTSSSSFNFISHPLVPHQHHSLLVQVQSHQIGTHSKTNHPPFPIRPHYHLFQYRPLLEISRSVLETFWREKLTKQIIASNSFLTGRA